MAFFDDLSEMATLVDQIAGVEITHILAPSQVVRGMQAWQAYRPLPFRQQSKRAFRRRRGRMLAAIRSA